MEITRHPDDPDDLRNLQGHLVPLPKVILHSLRSILERDALDDPTLQRAEDRPANEIL